MRPARLLAALGAALVAGACHLAPPPEVVVTTEVGVVRASERGVALETAEDLPRLVDALRAELVGTRDDPVEVWVQDEVALYRGARVSHDIGGFTHRALDRVHVVAGDRAERTLYLAHELVHLLLDDTWRALPLGVEEGLCDHLALGVTGYDGARVIARHVAGASLAVGELRFTVHLVPTARDGTRSVSWGRIGMTDDPRALDAWLARREDAADTSFDTDASVRMRGVGYVLARCVLERGGVEALRALCLRAASEGRERVPTPWLLDAAGLRGDVADDWRHATSRLAGAREVALIAEAHREALADAIAALLHAKGVTPDRAFTDLTLRLALGDERPRHTITDHSPLGRAITERLATR